MRQKKFLMSLLAILSLSAGLCLGACSSETDPEGDPQTDADASVTPGQDDASEPGTGPVGEVPLPEGGLRVSVIDELTRRPVLGATVVASVGGVEHALTAQNDERYLAIVDSDAAATVSVFHADYHYVTVADVSARDLVIAVRRLPTARRGGLKGNMANVWPETPEDTITIGIVGLAVQGNLLDFEPALFLGDARDTNFSLPSWLDPLVAQFAPGSETTFTFPGPGSVLIGDKTDYSVFGLPSPCGNEALEREGACGKQAAFSAFVSIGSISDPIVGQLLNNETSAFITSVLGSLSGETQLDLASMLPQLLPMLPTLFSVLNYDYATNRELTFGDRSHELDDKNWAPSLKFDQSRKVTLPAPPVLMGNEPADLVGALALADFGDQGLIPLGVGASQSSNLTFDMTVTSGREDLNSAGRKVLAIALDSDLAGAITDTEMDINFSAIVESFDTLAEEGTTLTGSFLGAPTGSSFDAATRKISSLPSVEGASLYRAMLTGTDRRWSIYFGGESTAVTLPAVPAGFADVVSAEAAYTMIALRLGESVTFESLFADDEANADRLNDLMNAFSITVH